MVAGGVARRGARGRSRSTRTWRRRRSWRRPGGPRRVARAEPRSVRQHGAKDRPARGARRGRPRARPHRQPRRHPRRRGGRRPGRTRRADARPPPDRGGRGAVRSRRGRRPRSRQPLADRTAVAQPPDELGLRARAAAVGRERREPACDRTGTPKRSQHLRRGQRLFLRRSEGGSATLVRTNATVPVDPGGSTPCRYTAPRGRSRAR